MNNNNKRITFKCKTVILKWVSCTKNLKEVLKEQRKPNKYTENTKLFS